MSAFQNQNQDQNQDQDNECPICFDPIEKNKNCVTTECGHTFHCGCLMKNSATNGFGCPMCRQIMAETYSEPDSDEWTDIYEDETFGDDALTSFRMFNQRLDGEDIEEEIEEAEEDIEEAEEEDTIKPTAAHIAEKLIENGISMEDLVKSLLIDHEEYDNPAGEETDNDRKSDQIFGSIRAIISRYKREHQDQDQDLDQEQIIV